jgi:hypothetical protein
MTAGTPQVCLTIAAASNERKKKEWRGRRTIYQSGCDDIQDRMNFDLLPYLSLTVFPDERNAHLIPTNVLLSNGLELFCLGFCEKSARRSGSTASMFMGRTFSHTS